MLSKRTLLECRAMGMPPTSHSWKENGTHKQICGIKNEKTEKKRKKPNKTEQTNNRILYAFQYLFDLMNNATCC